MYNYRKMVKFILIPIGILIGGTGALSNTGTENKSEKTETNLEKNPNQFRWKFSSDTDFQCIKWGTPLSGAPVKATIIGPCFAYRDVVELCLRLSLKVNRIMTSNYTAIAEKESIFANLPDEGDKPEKWNRLVYEELKAETDVIVIGKVQWQAFSNDQKNKIIDKIKNGCGLLYINPDFYSENNKTFINLEISVDKDKFLPDNKKSDTNKEENPLTEDFWNNPDKGKNGDNKDQLVKKEHLVEMKKIDETHYCINSLKNINFPLVDGKTLAQITYTGKLGKGRIIAVDFNSKLENIVDSTHFTYSLNKNDMYGSKAYAFRHCLVPTIFLPNTQSYYEYLMSFIAKCLLWTAGREPVKKITDIYIQKEKLYISFSEKDENMHVMVEIRDSAGLTGNPIFREDSATLPLKIENLPKKDYFINVWLKDSANRVHDWGTLAINGTLAPESEKLIGEFIIPRAAPLKGQTLNGTLELLSVFPPDECLKLYVKDNFQRVLYEAIYDNPKSSINFYIPIPDGKTNSIHLIAERIQRGNILEQKSKIIPLNTRALDGDFAFIVWSDFSVADRVCIQNIEMLKKMGVDALMYVTPSLYDKLYDSNMRIVDYGIRITDKNIRGYSDPNRIQFCYDHIRKQTEIMKPFAPLLVTLGDETYFAQGDDGAAVTGALAHSDYSNEDFRDFLFNYLKISTPPLSTTENKWNKDYRKINKILGTNFASLEEIKVKPISQLRNENNCPQWMMQAIWVDWMFRRIMRTGVAAVKHNLPFAYCGDEGLGEMRSGYGHDFYKESFEKDFYCTYDNKIAGQWFTKSFSSSDSLRGLITGTYGYINSPINEEWMGLFPWRALFYNMNSIMWWWSGWAIKCNGKPIPAFAKIAEQINLIKKGYATLLLRASDPVAPVVAVIYSPNTVHTETFYKMPHHPAEQCRHKGSIIRTCEALTRGGIPFVILHQDQLDDNTELQKNYKAIILPAVNSLSLRQLNTIKEFVKKGGALLGDEVTDPFYNELGVPYKSNPFKQLSQNKQKYEYEYGKGKILLTTIPFSPSHIYRFKDKLENTYTWKTNKPLADIFRDFISSVTHYNPPVALKTSAGGNYEKYGEINLFQNGSAMYIGIARSGRYYEAAQARWVKWPDYLESGKFELSLQTDSYLYDSINGKYLGYGKTFMVDMNSTASLFAALQCKIDEIIITGIKQQYTQGSKIEGDIKLSSSGGHFDFLSTINISVKDKNGDNVQWLSQNIIIPPGGGRFSIPLAFNERNDEYIITFKDVASGISSSRKLIIREVTKNTSSR